MKIGKGTMECEEIEEAWLCFVALRTAILKGDDVSIQEYSDQLAWSLSVLYGSTYHNEDPPFSTEILKTKDAIRAEEIHKAVFDKFWEPDPVYPNACRRK